MPTLPELPPVFELSAGDLILVFDDQGQFSGKALLSNVIRFAALPVRQVVSTATADVDPNTDIVEVTYSAGKPVITLPSANGAKPILFVKRNTSSFGVEIAPSGVETIQGGNAGASVSPASMTAPSSTSDQDPSCRVYSRGVDDWGLV